LRIVTICAALIVDVCGVVVTTPAPSQLTEAPSTGPSGGPSEGPWDDNNMAESPSTKVKIVVTGDLTFADLALDTEEKIAVFKAAVKGTMASSLRIHNDWISVEIVLGRRLSLKPSTSVIAKYKVEIPKGTPTLLTGNDLVDQIGELKYNAAKKNEFVDVLNAALDGSGVATLDAAKIAVSTPVSTSLQTPLRPAVPASSSTQNNGIEGGHRSTASTSERLGSSLAVLSVIALAIS